LEQSLELQLMGLELSEDVWKQKWEQQHQWLEAERNRLRDWERELKKKEVQVKQKKGRENKENDPNVNL